MALGGMYPSAPGYLPERLHGRQGRHASYRMLEQLAAVGSPIAHELLHRISSDCRLGRPFDEAVDEAVGTALQHLWSEANRNRVAALPAAAATPAAPKTITAEHTLATELLTFVAGLPLQDHPIKVQKEREAIVNRAITTLRPAKKLG